MEVVNFHFLNDWLLVYVISVKSKQRREWKFSGMTMLSRINNALLSYQHGSVYLVNGLLEVVFEGASHRVHSNKKIVVFHRCDMKEKSEQQS